MTFGNDRRAQARLGEQLGRAVDADDLADMRRERERERACSGARVERTLVPRRLDEAADVLGQLGPPALLELGELRRGLTPTIA